MMDPAERIISSHSALRLNPARNRNFEFKTSKFISPTESITYSPSLPSARLGCAILSSEAKPMSKSHLSTTNPCPNPSFYPLCPKQSSPFLRYSASSPNPAEFFPSPEREKFALPPLQNVDFFRRFSLIFYRREKFVIFPLMEAHFFPSTRREKFGAIPRIRFAKFAASSPQMASLRKTAFRSLPPRRELPDRTKPVDIRNRHHVHWEGLAS